MTIHYPLANYKQQPIQELARGGTQTCKAIDGRGAQIIYIPGLFIALL